MFQIAIFAAEGLRFGCGFGASFSAFEGEAQGRLWGGGGEDGGGRSGDSVRFALAFALTAENLSGDCARPFSLSGAFSVGSFCRVPVGWSGTGSGDRVALVRAGVRAGSISQSESMEEGDTIHVFIRVAI